MTARDLARDVVRGVAGTAYGAARHPWATTGLAIGLAKGAVSGSASLASSLLRTAMTATVPAEVRPGATTAAQPGVQPGVQPATPPAGRPVLRPVPGAARVPQPTVKQPAATQPEAPQPVLREPAAPDLPPVDVVGQALAAEAAHPDEHRDRDGRATEPRGSSRLEEHGEAPIERAEHDEWDEETAEALGAAVEDVAVSDEPLLDPSLTKAVKAESDTLRRAAGSDQG